MVSNQIEIFFSYSKEDVKLRNELAKHLRGLERKGVITAWHDSEISAGQERTEEIERHLNSAIIILLLVSPDYIASDELWERQVTQASNRSGGKSAIAIRDETQGKRKNAKNRVDEQCPWERYLRVEVRSPSGTRRKVSEKMPRIELTNNVYGSGI